MSTPPFSNGAAASLVFPPRWVLLREEGRQRGFKNTLAFRRWCRRHDVPIRTDGRFQWVASSDVDAVVARLSPQGTPSQDDVTTVVDPVAAGVADVMMSARTRR